MPKFIKHHAVFALALLLTTVSASADDLDIYRKAQSKPKILFVLDTSGSMGAHDGGPTSRIDRMKTALAALLSNIRGVDVGLMRYAAGTAQLIHPVEDAETSQGSLLAAANSLTAGGGTPTVAAMIEAQRYLSGGQPYRGVEPSGLANYQQPATNQCESNHIVLLTDGRPTTDATAVADLTPIVGGCAARPSGRGTCGAELAGYMANVDQFAGIPGNNNITLHSIGFNIADSWLESLAQAGGGIYRNASSSQELLDVFRSILDSVQLTSTAAAPTVSVNAFNQSRHSNELYYSLFQPSIFPRWEGNIKKYRLVNGEIVDSNNQPIIENGIVSETSASLWSVDSSGTPIADGEKVQSGGMAALQPSNRRWYTDAGVTHQPNGGATPQRITSPGQVDAHWFGATSGNERDILVNWVRGYDSIDRDSDADTNEPNHYVADSIHSSPVLITYSAQQSTGLRREALFSVNNMGVLHAINPDTGEELWSYSPAELLPNVKHYVDNLDEEHVYGLDGVIATDVTYKASTTLDAETERVRLFLTQRRGGSHIFALDVSNALSSNPIERLWKIEGGIPDTQFRDLAQTWSTPRIVPIRYGCPTNCEVKSALLFGGGYNPVYDDETLSFPVSRPATGHGNAIYLVDPDNGALLWSAGNGGHHALDIPSMNDSVPDTPVPVDTDGDGVVNVIFYSDIAGNVWRVDLDQEAESANTLAIDGDKIASLNAPGGALRFFNRPDVSINGVTNGVASFSISIGSGMRSSPTFNEPANNRLFVIRDNWVFSNPTTYDAATGTRVPDYRYVVDTSGNRSIITPGVLSTGTPTQYGFYQELPSGEKVLQPTLTHANRIFLTSYTPPDSSAAADPCAYQTGESKLYIIDVDSGENKLPNTYGNPSATIGSGIVDGGAIVDTGGSGGPDFLIGTSSEKLFDLLGGDNPDNFRRFIRTGWSELDD